MSKCVSNTDINYTLGLPAYLLQNLPRDFYGITRGILINLDRVWPIQSHLFNFTNLLMEDENIDY